MKICIKFLSLIIIISILLSLSGCVIIPVHKYYDDIETDKVASIDIYDLRNCEAFSSGFLETEVPVYTLNEEQIEDFWEDLAEIRFTDYIIIALAAVDPSFHYGDWVVRLNYTNNYYELISSGGYGEIYDNNDEVVDTNHYGCEDDEWESFVTQFLPDDYSY